MNVLITGTSNGVGKAAARKFLAEGHNVFGMDIKEATITHDHYFHYQCDVADLDKLPEITNINIIVNNAGIVTPKAEAIRVNQIGYINIIKKYGRDPQLKSMLIIGSTASQKGYDNLEYCSSQGARDAMVKWCANNFSRDHRHVIVNGLQLDGIVAADPAHGIEGTSLEPELYAADGLMDQIANLSILKRLSTVEEIAEWIYFMTAINTVVTGQIIACDGELTGAYEFIPYPGWDD